jgi:hypothetical protein
MTHFPRHIQNCATEECRRRTPLNVVRVHRRDIPDNAISLATDLGARKLLLQFFGDKMIFVPELHYAWVGDA